MVDLDRGDSPQQSPNTYTGREIPTLTRARRGGEVLKQTGVRYLPASEIPNGPGWEIDDYDDPREVMVVPANLVTEHSVEYGNSATGTSVEFVTASDGGRAHHYL